MQRRPILIPTSSFLPKSLALRFKVIRTDDQCLKSLNGFKIELNGKQGGIVRVGEDVINHIPIFAEKRFWCTQFVIIVKNDKYYLLDLGNMFPTRIKLDYQTEITLSKDALVDFGKGVLYRFDSLSYKQKPIVDNSLYMKRAEKEDYTIVEGNPHVLARAIWVNADNFEQNILNIEAKADKKILKIGRKREAVDIPVVLEAISGDHCRIEYCDTRGWLLSEKGMAQSSTNGTYFFIKSNMQTEEQQPSDPVLLTSGMTLASFNYEI
jgi:hypothetical protein